TFCSGSSEIIEYLVKFHNFEFICLGQPTESRIKPTKNFKIFEELLNYTTINWNSNFVTISITDLDQLEAARKRPFVLVVFVDSPILKRFDRYMIETQNLPSNKDHLMEFVLLSDKFNLEFSSSLKSRSQQNSVSIPSSLDFLPFSSSSDLQIFNNFDSPDDLFFHLDAINLLDTNRLRPSWDLYFMKIAELSSHRSNCMKRRVGCILVQNNQILSTGYNGTPKNLKNCNEGGCKRCNEGAKQGTSLDECLCIHAEENALLQIGANRISSGYCILYCNTCPCLGCSKKIVQAGVKEVVYNQEYGMDEKTARLFSDAKIILRRFLLTL
ncbi:hypothetical protein BB560_004501, partial [Smittium megazygosporum]